MLDGAVALLGSDCLRVWQPDCHRPPKRTCFGILVRRCIPDGNDSVSECAGAACRMDGGGICLRDICGARRCGIEALSIDASVMGAERMHLDRTLKPSHLS